MTRLDRKAAAKPIGNGQQLTARGYIISADTDAAAWDAAHDAYEATRPPPPAVLAQAREDLDAACARAAWAPRPASPSTQSSSPKAAAQQEPPPRQAPPIARNAPPATPWEALRRLLACNRQQLAARLGISRHTLQRWERGDLTEAGAAKVAAIMQETLAAAGAGWTVNPLFSPRTLERGKPHQPLG